MSWLDDLGDGWKNTSNINTDLQTEDVEDVNDLIKMAQEFFTFQPDRLIHSETYAIMLKNHRDTLIDADLWTSALEQKYQREKAFCKEQGYISDISEFEKGEKTWGTFEAAILKDKARKKQQIVKETGYKTACDIRKSISYRERNVMYEKNNGYSWSNIKDKKIKTIGYYWQAGIGVGTIDAHMIWFVYFGSSNKNDTFFTIAEITEQEYFDLQKKYEEFFYDDVEGIPSKQVASDIVKEIAEYVRNSKIIVEGWDLI